MSFNGAHCHEHLLAMNISWESGQSHQLINPAYSPSARKRFFRLLESAQSYPGHIWLATSGSTSQKWVGLSKEAILASAACVNRHLESGRDDRWVNALPLFHVGGLGILARSFLSGAAFYNFLDVRRGNSTGKSSLKWSAEAFYCYVEEVKGTLSSLVPAQLYDLISMDKPPPPSLRALIIGGRYLLPSLYEKAAALGWPVLATYGSTECASQVASSPLQSLLSLDYPALQLLPHILAKSTEDRLSFCGPSLLSAYAYFENGKVVFADPKAGGWWQSEDKGIIRERELQLFGRADAIVKVGGESVDLFFLENILQTLRLQHGIDCEATLVAGPDARLGASIQLATDSRDRESIRFLAEIFDKEALPFERIRQFHFVDKLPRSPLGKILKARLMEMISSG